MKKNHDDDQPYRRRCHKSKGFGHIVSSISESLNITKIKENIFSVSHSISLRVSIRDCNVLYDRVDFETKLKRSIYIVSTHWKIGKSFSENEI